jgi:hypothetical protein
MSTRVPPLIARLTAAIADEHVVARRDRWRARLAAELARRNEVVEAEALVADLRRTWQHSGDVRVVPSLNFADACVDRAAGRGEAALAKLKRSHALAKAARQPSLAALSAAWLGHVLWNREELEPAAAFLAEAVATAGASGAGPSAVTVVTDALDDHAALCRAATTVAEILLISRRADLATPWFRHARLHAAAIGDDAAFVALAHNAAVVEVMLLRQSTLTGEPSASDARAAELQASTAGAAARLFGMAPEPLAPLREAQRLSLLGRAAEALALYRTHAGSVVDVSVERARAEWLADEAWCEARLGALEAARTTAGRAEAALGPGTQRDDRAALWSRLARVHAALGDAALSRELERRAARAWSLYAAWQDTCAETAGALPLPPLPPSPGFAVGRAAAHPDPAPPPGEGAVPG